MAADCLFLFTFYVAILSVMVEVHRIKLIRGKSRNKGVLRRSSTSSLNLAGSVQTDSPTGKSVKPNGDHAWTGKNQNKDKDQSQPENPVVRLKLFLIVSFLTLHILNLCTTLTEQTALMRHSNHSIRHTARFDARSPTLSPLLDALYERHSGSDMAVQIVPATNILMTSDNYTSSRMASIDHFMSGWTQLVGDPVLSKWIVVALGISVILNGYLLKGIASNSIGGKGPVASAAQALAGIFEATISQASDGRRSRRPSAPAKLDRRLSGGLTPRRFSRSGRPGTIIIQPPSVGGDETPKRDDSKGHVFVPDTPKVPIMPRPSALEKSPSFENLQGTTFGRRPLDECVEIFAGGVGANNLSDEEVILLVEKGKVAHGGGKKTEGYHITVPVSLPCSIVQTALTCRSLPSSQL